MATPYQTANVKIDIYNSNGNLLNSNLSSRHHYEGANRLLEDDQFTHVCKHSKKNSAKP